MCRPLKGTQAAGGFCEQLQAWRDHTIEPFLWERPGTLWVAGFALQRLCLLRCSAVFLRLLWCEHSCYVWCCVMRQLPIGRCDLLSHEGLLTGGLTMLHCALPQRLFDYISGANKDGKKIPMTAPVVTAVLPGQGYALQLPFQFSQCGLHSFHAQSVPAEHARFARMSVGGWSTR